MVRCAVPVMATAWALSVFGGVAQGGLVFAPEALAPKIARLNPAQKLSQMFSLTGLSGLLKSLLPFAAIVYVGLTVSATSGRNPVRLQYQPLVFQPLSLTAIFEVAWKSARCCWSWRWSITFSPGGSTEGDLRMCAKNCGKKCKDTDGNPQVKMRVRRLQRQIRKQFMLSETEKATVVVINPTHFAVAMLYQIDMSAPIVIAKGQNLLAQKMKQIARWKEIPVLENPPLAQALYKTVDVGQSIPAKLYTAVAEVLAFVYRAQAK